MTPYTAVAVPSEIVGEPRVSYAFSGAFFAWPYHAGVAAYVQDNGLVGDHSRIFGTSSGAVVATMLACGVDVARVGTPAAIAANAEAQGDRRTPFFRPRDVIRIYFDTFGKVLPADAHRRATGRLHVAVTRLPRMRRAVISDFPTRQALLDALAASIALPGVTVGLAYRTAALGWCIDGGLEAPDDDRAGVRTVRVGVGPRLPGVKRDDIEPSQPVAWDLRFLLPPAERRLGLFELGYADARRRLDTVLARPGSEAGQKAQGLGPRTSGLGPERTTGDNVWVTRGPRPEARGPSDRDFPPSYSARSRR